MTEIKIGQNFAPCAEWCDKNISERTYWIHNAVGGPGWQVFRTGAGWQDHSWTLKVEDEGDAIVYRLVGGGK